MQQGNETSWAPGEQAWTRNLPEDHISKLLRMWLLGATRGKQGLAMMDI